jgi:hypothetical protein
VIAEHLLPRPTLRGPTREHRRQAADHLALFAVGRSSLLVTCAQLLERTPRAIHALAELLGSEFALGGGVGQPPQLGRLDLELAPEIDVATTRRAPPQRDRETPQEPDDHRSERGCPCLGRHGPTPVSVVMVRP